MIKEKLLTIREAAAYLGISEKAIIELSERGIIPAYKIAGVYLRFKQEQLKNVKIKPGALQDLKDGTTGDGYVPCRRTFVQFVADFIYFNDFYFFCFILCMILLYVVFKA